jgi:hypothetical protein
MLWPRFWSRWSIQWTSHGLDRTITPNTSWESCWSWSTHYLVCNTLSTLRLVVLTPSIPLGSYILLIDQHKSFVRTLSTLMLTWEDFPVCHPSQDCSRPSTLNIEVLSRHACEKEYSSCWYKYSINSIKPWTRISHNPPGPRYHNPPL